MENNKEIIFLKPQLKDVVWGGSKLRDEFGYEGAGENTGECWGISAHPNGDDEIINGRFQGMTLSALYKEHREVFGGISSEEFPLLVKIIDAKQDLSIQVHPDDSYVKEHENCPYGKTECWYVMDCPEGAELVIGHNAKTREELADMIHEGRYEELIKNVPVRKGDFLQITPGTVHAIKGGFTILETQQSSDITYRVYDYGRLVNGKERPLHVQQSIDVITVPDRAGEEALSHTDGLPENTLNELEAAGSRGDGSGAEVPLPACQRIKRQRHPGRRSRKERGPFHSARRLRQGRIDRGYGTDIVHSIRRKHGVVRTGK